MGSRKKKINNKALRTRFIEMYQSLSPGDKCALKNGYWVQYRMNFLEILNCKHVMELLVISANVLKNRIMIGYDYWAGW
ncbi:MAG TPA: hypothetical protein PL045_02745 [Chitinophagaceae bacterium]|nr:hypothetical protein [Chitinophagaceae bacterium]